MGQLDASAVAALLREFGRRVEMAGDSPYKSRAYFRAAESLLAQTAPLDELIEQGALRSIPGVGAAIAEKIATLHATGTHPTLERLRADVPASALEVLDIPGLPAGKGRQIVRDLGIGSLEELEEACRLGRLAEVKGLGPALQDRILQGLSIRRRSEGQRLIHHAGELLDAAAGNLAQSHPELRRVALAGDFPRGCELVHEVALVAEAPFEVGRVERVGIGGGIALFIADAPLYGVAQVLATGSAAHVGALAERARVLGLTLDETGLRRAGEFVPAPEEAAVYEALGLAWIPPELREGGDEIALAAAGRLPRLVEAQDIRGVLHCHTTRSDGSESLATMAKAARERGYRYFGVADHSVSAGYAGGLSIEAVREQGAEADGLNRATRGFRVLKGIESDIRVDGALDYPDEVLASFDLVVASVHSRFRLSEAEQTSRILRAVANPHTTILGHMTGRMLLRREGYELDVERVLAACAENGVAVEINANPHRLDLDWRWHRRALELGCTMSINPDAHSVGELDYMRWGLAVARKGGVPPDRVLNAMSLRELTSFLRNRKQAPS